MLRENRPTASQSKQNHKDLKGIDKKNYMENYEFIYYLRNCIQYLCVFCTEKHITFIEI